MEDVVFNSLADAFTEAENGAVIISHPNGTYTVPGVRHKTCAYCPSNQKECRARGCYAEIMNKSGSEHRITITGLIVPVKYTSPFEGIKWKPSKRQKEFAEDTNRIIFYGTGMGKDWIKDYLALPQLSFDIETTSYDEATEFKDDVYNYFYGGGAGAGKTNTLAQRLREAADKIRTKQMDIYSFPLNKCSKNIWCTARGQLIPVNKLALPHFENVYDKLMRSAWHIVGEQSRISKVCSDLAYEGRYHPYRMDRTVSFLNEFCPSWHVIVKRAMREGIGDVVGKPYKWDDIHGVLSITIPRKEKALYEQLKDAEWTTAGAGKSETKVYGINEAVWKDKVKLTNGKIMTDSSGNQYLLFPVE